VSNKRQTSNRTAFLIIVIAAAVAAIAAALFLVRGRAGLPAPGSDAYEQVTGAFYRGLASLEVGLLDDARREFTAATELVPQEAASWANLGLTRLRLGELDAAVEPIERARTLAPASAEIALLAGRADIARGQLDAGVAHLRRAVELDPGALRARFALADELERAAGPDADVMAMAALDDLAQRAPDNAAILVERARLSAKTRNADTLADSIRRLEPLSSTWSPMALEQFRALQTAAAAGDFPLAQRSTIFLRNVLARVPAFIESLSAVRIPTELVADPIVAFVALTPPSATPARLDAGLSFATELVSPLSSRRALLALPLDADTGAEVVAVDEAALRRFGAREGAWPLAGGAFSELAALDWNNDFRTDLVATGGGLRLFVQDESGGFIDRTAEANASASFACDCVAAWGADLEMDGDLDIVAAPAEGAPLVLQNNGNGTWAARPMFQGVSQARAFAWADLDRDVDPDAVFVDARGTVQVFTNRQAGDFVPAPAVAGTTDVVAMAVADVDADGTFDIVTLERSGVVRRVSRNATAWDAAPIAEWQGLNRAAPGSHRILAADLDNNGALDLIASGTGESRIWLADEQYRFSGFQATPEGEVFSVADLNADGRLDLVALAAPGALRHMNRGAASYHWKTIRPRAQRNAGDQRMNSFGVGGTIEVRSGLLFQKHLLSGGPVHVGLGQRTTIDVARIVWPNGVAQAEFGGDVDDVLVAEQRLKGSCPWVFAWDGTRMRFVTDFLWRSPLGLRINAQDTAGVVQTEDWVRLGAEQLAPRDGVYDLRITAELWETHFFDHVSLMVVDHQPDADIFVDERFSAAAAPALTLHAVENRRSIVRARDHHGADVTDVVARKDGRYLATFAKSRYQGIAEEHWVEIEAGETVRGLRPVLLASGWIYPTDSSINVAMAQGGVRPMGLSLEAQSPDGRWRVVDSDLGFPAGKNKTIVVDLGGIGDARRLRLRTNLEIYWDSLEYANGVDAALRTKRLPAQRASLRYRGFSHTTSRRDTAPETPDYHRIATTSPQWRDLIGYHTRFGDVDELLLAVDDRYVIMNAGDELQLQFAEQPAPDNGWRRDFVLIGDGWEKDGDYNTAFSQTVLPLPSHARPDYGSGVTTVELEDDPVYRRHRLDWERYHTRYVTPRDFVNGLSRKNRSRITTH
jgi:tetratricopeptide (TPR) repeat protein